MTFVYIASAVAAALLLYGVGLGIGIYVVALRRPNGKDYNFKPGIDDEESFPPSGNTPYRKSSRDSNIWWNSQPLERWETESDNGLKLAGHLLRSETGGKKVALVVHGHQSVSGEMGFICKIFHDAGYNVLCPDQRAHGKSEGRNIGMGFYERYDMLRWLDRINDVFGADCDVVVHGLSMGAATVMMMSSLEQLPGNVRCVVEDCGYTDAYDSILFHVQRDFKLLPFKRYITSWASFFSKLLSGYSLKEACPLEAVKHARTPMMFIHGTDDAVVPFEMVNKLCEACPTEKRIYTVPGAQHGVAYFKDPDRYCKEMFGFINRFLS